MKRLLGMLGVVVIVAGTNGCGDNMPQVDPSTVTQDNRPAGFENMMRGMEGQMKKAGANPKGLSKK